MSGPERFGADGGCEGNAAPYVLGALTEDEHEDFVRHLATCAVCREEVAALQSVATMLPATAPALSAPRGLKKRVMREVADGPRPPAAVQTPRAERAPRWRALAPALAGAAAIVAVAVALLAGGGGGGSTRVISAQVRPPGSSALLKVSGGRGELNLAGMPATRAGQVYEVWVKRSGGPEATDALFTVTSRGQATVAVPGSMAGVRVVMVTAEPLGGTSVPTSPPAIVAQLG